MNLGPVAKAVVGAFAAGVAPYTSALDPASHGGARVTAGEWLTVTIAVLVGSAAVWRADNVRWFRYAKAAAAALVVFLGALAPAFLADQTASVPLILDALVKTALAFGLVSQVPNAAETEWQDPAGGDGELEPEDDDPAGEHVDPWATPIVDLNGQDSAGVDVPHRPDPGPAHPFANQYVAPRPVLGWPVA